MSQLSLLVYLLCSLLINLVNSQRSCSSQLGVQIFSRSHCIRTEVNLVNGKPFPSLIDVTTEELVTGLESGQFTSADLVAV